MYKRVIEGLRKVAVFFSTSASPGATPPEKGGRSGAREGGVAAGLKEGTASAMPVVSVVSDAVELSGRLRRVVEGAHREVLLDPEVQLLCTAIETQCRTGMFWYQRKDKKAPSMLTWEAWGLVLSDAIGELERVGEFEAKHRRGIASRRAQVCECLSETTRLLAWLTTDAGLAVYWQSQNLVCAPKYRKLGS